MVECLKCMWHVEDRSDYGHGGHNNDNNNRNHHRCRCNNRHRNNNQSDNNNCNNYRNNNRNNNLNYFNDDYEENDNSNDSDESTNSFRNNSDDDNGNKDVENKGQENEQQYTLKVDFERGENPQSHEIIAAVKQNSGWFRKKELEEEMKDIPSAAYLVLGCRAPKTKVKLVAIGYKYNARKVLCFVMSRNAGTTRPGSPYIARFPDKHGNVKERNVVRPDCISQYFGRSNAIDAHNHQRQSCLQLESLWRTPNPWFRLSCTVIRMTVVDCFNALRFHVKKYQKWSVAEFADSLAWDLVNNPFPGHANQKGHDNGNIADSHRNNPHILLRAVGGAAPSLAGVGGAGILGVGASEEHQLQSYIAATIQQAFANLSIGGGEGATEGGLVLGGSGA